MRTWWVPKDSLLAGHSILAPSVDRNKCKELVDADDVRAVLQAAQAWVDAEEAFINSGREMDMTDMAAALQVKFDAYKRMKQALSQAQP